MPRAPGYLAIIGRLWLAALVTLVAVAAAAAYTKSQPPVYRASMKIVVGQGTAFFQPDSANATEPFTQTMSDLVKSDVVADLVIKRLQLDTDAATLINNLTVSTQPLSAVLDVSYDDTDQVRGQRILAEVGQVFSELVQDRFNPPDKATAKTPPVSVAVWDPAHTLPTPIRPKPALYLAVATVLGLALGLVATLALAQLNRPGATPLRLEARAR
jgi:capsular polysaccharide biosynthesis protein